MLPNLLTFAQVATALEMSETWVQATAEAGAAPSLRIGQHTWRVRESDLDEWREVRAYTPDPATAEGWIYFVQGAYGGPIKIGFTADVRRRLAGIQSCSPVPLRLLAARPGTILLERRYHLRFREWRLHGEWFAWEADGLSTTIAAARREYGNPSIWMVDVEVHGDGQRHA